MSVKKINRIFMLIFLLCLVASVLLVRYAASWLTDSSTELGLLRSEASVLEGQWTSLERAKKILADQASEVETLRFVLPEDKEQARVIKELTAIADQANVKIDSVGFPSSTLGSVAAPKPVATPTDTATTTTDTATQGSTPAPAPAKSISQATPIKEIPGVQAIELSIGTITSKDTSIKGIRYSEMIDLMRLIERNRRTMQIRSIGIGQTQNPGSEPTYDLTLTIVIFIQP